MTEETCSWEQLVEKNKVLQETIDKLKLAQAVAAQLPGSARTQTYQTPGSEVEVDMKFAKFVFEKGIIYEFNGGNFECSEWEALQQVIEAYKAQQADSPTIDHDSD